MAAALMLHRGTMRGTQSRGQRTGLRAGTSRVAFGLILPQAWQTTRTWRGKHDHHHWPPDADRLADRRRPDPDHPAAAQLHRRRLPDHHRHHRPRHHPLTAPTAVTPAKAGPRFGHGISSWIPAFPGMTREGSSGRGVAAGEGAQGLVHGAVDFETLAREALAVAGGALRRQADFLDPGLARHRLDARD